MDDDSTPAAAEAQLEDAEAQPKDASRLKQAKLAFVKDAPAKPVATGDAAAAARLDAATGAASRVLAASKTAPKRIKSPNQKIKAGRR